MNLELEAIKDKISTKKQLHLAKSEMYPQTLELVDSSLKLRGVCIATALKHGCSEEDLWKWIITQIID